MNPRFTYRPSRRVQTSAKPLSLAGRIGSAWRTLTTGVEHRSSYAMARVDRLVEDWVASYLSADDKIRGNLKRMRNRAREMAENNGFVKNYLQMLATNVIGPHGMRHRGRVRLKDGELDVKANKLLQEAWESWRVGRVTRCGRFSLVRFEHTLIKQLGRDGEVLVRLWRNDKANPHRLTLEGIDPAMLDDEINRKGGDGVNEIRMGVEVDKTGRPVAYHLRPVEAGITYSPRAGERIPADQVLHIYDPDSVNQTRGVPWVHAVAFPMKMLAGYMEAELIAARTGAAKMGFIQTKDGAVAGEADLEDPNAAEEPLTMDANPGTIEQLPAGYEFKDWSPDHPTSSFGTFVKAILRWCASGLGIRYPGFANDAEGVNYSSMRQDLIVERDWYQVLQQLWISAFRTPVYEAWLEMAVLAGGVKLGSYEWEQFRACQWGPRGWDWVDPESEIKSAALAVASRLASRTEFAEKRGREWIEVAEELEREDLELKQRGIPATDAKAGETAGDSEGSDQKAKTEGRPKAGDKERSPSRTSRAAELDQEQVTTAAA